MKNTIAITNEFFKEQNEKYLRCKKNTVLRHALANTSMPNVVRSHDFANLTRNMFSIDVKTMDACNQKQSGRCWIFAACNVLREIIGKKLNIKQLELSQAYVAFFDKLEKVNYIAETIIDLIDKDYDDRELQFVLQSKISDGGQWDMFVNIVKKYGICPKMAMDETAQSNQSNYYNRLINANISKFAADVKNAYLNKGMDEVRKIQQDLLEKCYALLLNCYGNPVETFDFEYVDADNKYNIIKNLTPKSFFDKYIGNEIDEYVSIINAPTKDKPFNKSYTVKYLGNVVEGREIRHLNVTMDRLKELVIESLKNDEIVWFGSDVGFYGAREEGLWDDLAFDYATPFGLDFKMDKGEALDYRMSAMNHAMCITGVNLDSNAKETKWKIENSWGTENGNKGYYVMSKTWFDRFTYQAVTKKKYLTKDELDAYLASPVELKPWDPMGTLAD